MDDIYKDKLLVTHLNIRPSISILIIQIILLNFLAAVVLIGMYSISLLYLPLQEFLMSIKFGILVISGVLSLQIFMVVYATLVWIHEYYEIWPKYITHKKGLLFKKLQKYPTSNVRLVQMHQDFWGKILNYGTITLSDIRRNKLMEMYLIHNPVRYYQVLDKLFPKINTEGELLREKIVEEVDN